MGYLVLPVLLFLTVAPTPGSPARALGDVSRFSKAINKQIALVEADGTVREGVLVAAGPDGVTMRFASGTRSFALGGIASAERMKDGRLDGAIKGALTGLALAAMSQGYESSDGHAGEVLQAVASFAAIGYALDAAQTNRQLLYRAPVEPAGAASRPGLSLSFRF